MSEIKTQRKAVFDYLKRNMHRGVTIFEGKSALYHGYKINASETAVSARYRDLRKPEQGLHSVKTEKVGKKWLYTLTINPHTKSCVNVTSVNMFDMLAAYEWWHKMGNGKY